MEGCRSEKLLSLLSHLKKATEDLEKTDAEMRALVKNLEERTTISAQISMCLQIYTDHPDKVSSIKDHSPATDTEVAVTKAEEFHRCMKKFMRDFSFPSGKLKGDLQYQQSCVNQLLMLVERVEKANTEEELDSIKICYQSANVSDVEAIRRIIEEWEKTDLKRKVKEHLKELELLTGEKVLSTSD